MIWMALSKLLMAFSNLLAFMLVFPKRMNKGATGFTRVARSRTSMACKSNKEPNLLAWNSYSREQKSLGHLCTAKYYLCFTTEVCKKHCYPFKNVLLFPLPTQYNVETREKYPVSVGWGEKLARQVKLYSHLACVQKRQKCKFVPRLVDNCRFGIKNLMYLQNKRCFHIFPYFQRLTLPGQSSSRNSALQLVELQTLLTHG